MTKIKAVLFDLGRVLIDFDHTVTCRKLELRCGVPAEEIFTSLYQTDLVTAYDKGEISSRAYFEKIRDHLNADSLTFPEFKEMWCNIFEVNTDLVSLLDRIKPDKPKYILSNTNDLHWQTIEKMPLICLHFPVEGMRILSFRIGAMKPEAEAFTEAVNRAGVHISEILYIDDSPEYVKAFQDLGGHASVYDCRHTKTDDLWALFKEYRLITS